MSKLGKVDGKPRRIRAKKFTLSKEPNGDPVYSNGILLPYNEVQIFLSLKHGFDGSDINELDITLLDLTEELGITKYEEPEPVSKNGLRSGQTEGKFPEGLYKTDEENINNLWNHIENKIGYPITLVGMEKIDGSSITIGLTSQIPEGFICSRNLRKKLTINKIIGRRQPTLWETIKSWVGINPDLNIYEEVENDDDFVKYGKPYLDILRKCTYGDIILRGELNGGKLKGSGNKNNPASKESANIKLFGIDRINKNGIAEKLPYLTFKDEAEYLELPTVKEVFIKEFNSKEELLLECNNYFKTNMIEGIVVRTMDSKFSAKVMNLEYDSKK
jgi:RNAse (barnase) inhibitor barstar